MTVIALRDPPSHTEVRFSAVGIRRESARQIHLAMLYMGTDKSVHALHLCSHEKWDDEPSPQTFFWVQPKVREARARSAAALCRLIVDKRTLEKMPYGFNFDPSAHFDVNTGRFLAPNGSGLTCATFVLAVLRSVGVKLMDFDTWPKRPCDGPWQERMGRRLKLPMLAEQVGAPRFRPEEVVAGCVQPSYPGSATAIIRDGRAVLELLGAVEIACRFDLWSP